MNKINDNFFKLENGQVVHRTWLKVLINPILRFFQRPFTNNIWVIGSICYEKDDGYWVFCGYKFSKILHHGVIYE